jgi:ribonuclease-3
MTDRALQDLLDEVGWDLREPRLLREALRHPSFANEHPDAGESNQRLEFLGDAVVGLVVAEMLCTRFPTAREGDLTRWRAAIVSEQPLADAARRLKLDALLELGRGEELVGGRHRPSVLADAFEAVVAAAFVDGGLDAARAVVGAALEDRIATICQSPAKDPKSLLQERIQAQDDRRVAYRVVETSGPDHDKRFVVEIVVGDEPYATGAGSSKKAAEQAAAQCALERLEEGPAR